MILTTTVRNFRNLIFLLIFKGLIDALEIFCGLIIFSDSKAEDKIRFLFDLFDFNEIQSISLMDLEFMLFSVLIATSKIYGLG